MRSDLLSLRPLQITEPLAVIVKKKLHKMTIEELRNICISLPHATEDIKYGTDLCFSISIKIFCGIRIEGRFRTGIKCEESDFNDSTVRQVYLCHGF